MNDFEFHAVRVFEEHGIIIARILRIVGGSIQNRNAMFQKEAVNGVHILTALCEPCKVVEPWGVTFVAMLRHGGVTLAQAERGSIAVGSQVPFTALRIVLHHPVAKKFEHRAIDTAGGRQICNVQVDVMKSAAHRIRHLRIPGCQSRD